jgi:hypothetical protein
MRTSMRAADLAGIDAAIAEVGDKARFALEIKPVSG